MPEVEAVLNLLGAKLDIEGCRTVDFVTVFEPLR